MTRLRIAVPSGVGDVYWCLTKLQAFRQARQAEHVTLCIQRTHLPRAHDWASMVDFVNAAEDYAFRPDNQALSTGYSERVAPRGTTARPWRHLRNSGSQQPRVDCVFWPNAVVDTGRHLREWMPELELDLSFAVRTAPGPDKRVVVYVSSDGVNNSWAPNLGPAYWDRLIVALSKRFGQPPTLIGKSWDASFRARLSAPVEDLLDSTTLPEVAGIIERARVLVGIISGMTILGNHFMTPTVALYPPKFPSAFPWTWVKDGAPYVPIATDIVPPPEELAAIAADIARRG